MITDPRIDAYIDKAAPFAQPILVHLRKVVHSAIPQVEEGIKWGMPHFITGGRNVAGMAAFKAHCAFVIHGDGRQGAKDTEGMGRYGKIASLADLPPEEELVATLRLVVEEAGKARKRLGKPPAEAELSVPDDLAAALAGNAAAADHFAAFTAAQRRDYIAWITDAKRAETRARRLKDTIAWVAEGKRRNWKYEKR
ncbi:hypothetical protein GRI40_01745 [Altererythrobacter aerius]|uniref:YdhG-like domain-containing protein n=1 Tax=Tsuneonella aeria TaxID=1837929 RepID=A0A6I4TBH6_9SPHN|nr:YdeI/OmpD-associated family protein [Tsuneonella aeria]MXO73946.1 hypothetical protein [Tsuneonella aeria]